MADDQMDIDEPTPATTSKPQNAMAALMAGAKAKGKERANGDAAFGMSEEELKALNERDGMPWYARAASSDARDRARES